jgi:hypothetical protein
VITYDNWDCFGIDLGTSIVKAVAFRKDGEDLALESSRVKIYNPSIEEWVASGVVEEHFRKNGNITFPGALRDHGGPLPHGARGVGTGRRLLHART